MLPERRKVGAHGQGHEHRIIAAVCVGEVAQLVWAAEAVLLLRAVVFHLQKSAHAASRQCLAENAAISTKKLKRVVPVLPQPPQVDHVCIALQHNTSVHNTCSLSFKQTYIAGPESPSVWHAGSFVSL